VIIVDTNLISELLVERPNPRVVAWLDAQVEADLFITSVNVAAIAKALGAAAIATRNTRHFEWTGCALVNPWGE
jgi:predicted nucleic acid-binding protein